MDNRQSLQKNGAYSALKKAPLRAFFNAGKRRMNQYLFNVLAG